MYKFCLWQIPLFKSSAMKNVSCNKFASKGHLSRLNVIKTQKKLQRIWRENLKMFASQFNRCTFECIHRIFFFSSKGPCLYKCEFYAWKEIKLGPSTSLRKWYALFGKRLTLEFMSLVLKWRHRWNFWPFPDWHLTKRDVNKANSITELTLCSFGRHILTIETNNCGKYQITNIHDCARSDSDFKPFFFWILFLLVLI